jgi:hypothetical protein
LPFVGIRYPLFANPQNRNTNGYYRTSSPFGDNKAYLVSVNNDINPYLAYTRSDGISLRCFKNTSADKKVSFYRES